ncbi:alcohol oxidase [Favolaschia claudopus]|uniref:Alcohol oxidase n=1 Tax=Favolaschia claudopus TaxID=2862362 RepID=A0AAW0BX04_9AGAR
MWSIVLLGIAAGAFATRITNDSRVASGHTFDYLPSSLSGIVVGTKLSARGYSVLLIEAGKDLQNNSAIYNVELRGSGWTSITTPETDCNWHYVGSDVNGSALPVTIDSGKCVGGSSSINGMVWYRPAAAELDAIQSLGNPGWNSTTLFPYMQAIEHNLPPSAEQRADGADLVPAVHGFAGPVNVSFPVPMRIPEAQAIYKAAIALVVGVTDGPDLSARNGVSGRSWTIWWNPVAEFTQRASAAYSLLYPASKQQQTLTLSSIKNLRATGLQFGPATGGAVETVNARHEVLLAAGSLAILERSGVGSKSILHKFGIKQLVDLPGVGLNLQLFTNKSAALSEQLRKSTAARARAAVSAGAAVNVAGAMELFTTVTDLITKDKTPIVELISESFTAVMSSIFWPLTPLSRGHIHINSSNSRITPRFLTDDFDVQTAVEIAQRARALVYGTTGLRIVDASVIPFQLTSHTMSTIYAISQKAADLILSSR